jgi:hypothetical protein
MEDEDPPETVLRHANDLLAHGFGTYNLALRNCFDFHSVHLRYFLIME